MHSFDGLLPLSETTPLHLGLLYNSTGCRDKALKLGQLSERYPYFVDMGDFIASGFPCQLTLGGWPRSDEAWYLIAPAAILSFRHDVYTFPHAFDPIRDSLLQGS